MKTKQNKEKESIIKNLFNFFSKKRSEPSAHKPTTTTTSINPKLLALKPPQIKSSKTKTELAHSIFSATNANTCLKFFEKEKFQLGCEESKNVTVKPPCKINLIKKNKVEISKSVRNFHLESMLPGKTSEIVKSMRGFNCLSTRGNLKLNENSQSDFKADGKSGFKSFINDKVNACSPSNLIMTQQSIASYKIIDPGKRNGSLSPKKIIISTPKSNSIRKNNDSRNTTIVHSTRSATRKHSKKGSLFSPVSMYTSQNITSLGKSKIVSKVKILGNASKSSRNNVTDQSYKCDKQLHNKINTESSFCFASNDFQPPMKWALRPSLSKTPKCIALKKTVDHPISTQTKIELINEHTSNAKKKKKPEAIKAQSLVDKPIIFNKEKSRQIHSHVEPTISLETKKAYLNISREIKRNQTSFNSNTKEHVDESQKEIMIVNEKNDIYFHIDNYGCIDPDISCCDYSNVFDITKSQRYEEMENFFNMEITNPDYIKVNLNTDDSIVARSATKSFKCKKMIENPNDKIKSVVSPSQLLTHENDFAELEKRAQLRNNKNIRKLEDSKKVTLKNQNDSQKCQIQ